MIGKSRELPTNNHVQPLDLAQVRSVLDDVLVGRQEDLELTHTEVLLECTTLGRIALVRDHPNRGCPLGELSRPVGHRREGYNDKVWSSLSFHLNEERDKRDRLDCFSETLRAISVLGATKDGERTIYHLVCEDTIKPVVVQADHPLQAFHLVLLESTANKDARLLDDLL